MRVLLFGGTSQQDAFDDAYVLTACLRDIDTGASVHEAVGRGHHVSQQCLAVSWAPLLLNVPEYDWQGMGVRSCPPPSPRRRDGMSDCQSSASVLIVQSVCLTGCVPTVHPESLS